MDKEQLNRISELARKAKTIELTADELAEQKQLREMYIKTIRNNLEYQLQEMMQDKE